MPSADSAYKDDVAPEGSPFRPLTRFAASLGTVEYEEAEHVTDLFRQRAAAVVLEVPANPAEDPSTPPRTRGTAEQAFAAAEVRHRGEYYVPIEHHNPMEPYATTVIFEAAGKLTIYDKTQGVQNVQRYVCSVLGMEPDDVRVMSPFVGGAFGSGYARNFKSFWPHWRCARLSDLCACSDPAADVWARLPGRHNPADRARGERQRGARRNYP